jgi:hypothetical protein
MAIDDSTLQIDVYGKVSVKKGYAIAPATTTETKIPQWSAVQKTLVDGLMPVTTISSPGSDANIPTEKAAIATFAPISKGVTFGDSHDHNGGDGAQIDHVNLGNKGTNTHAQIDSFIASKAVASGLASLGTDSLVVQNPVIATVTPTAGKMPIAGEDGKIAGGWMPGGSNEFWQIVPGTPTRVSATRFNIADVANTNSYNKIFSKGRILKWTESNVFMTAMVASSSYADDEVIVNIVGSAFGSSFAGLQYALFDVLEYNFDMPSGYVRVGANESTTFWPREDVYVLSADLFLGTAGGGTGSTVVDVNDDGATLFSTKPTIVSTGTSDLDNVSTNPTTIVAARSKVTADVDSVTSTAPKDGQVQLFYYPVSWIYRS